MITLQHKSPLPSPIVASRTPIVIVSSIDNTVYPRGCRYKIRRWGFAPSAKISYDFTPIVSGGLEYYADYDAISNIASVHNQQQQLFVVTDLNVSPVWEINFGIGATASTDHLIFKMILGRRFDWGRHSPID